MSIFVDGKELDNSFLASLQILKRECSALIAQQKLPQKGCKLYNTFFDCVQYLDHHHETLEWPDWDVTHTRALFMAHPPTRYPFSIAMSNVTKPILFHLQSRT